MGSYLGAHAKLYDLFYSEKPYSDETRFVHDCLCRFSQTPVTNILELACGTGRHALELEKLGYRVTAIDYSHDMLNEAKHRAKHTGSTVNFLLQDMREINLPNQRFDAVVSFFDSIGYVQTNEGIEKVLLCVKNHLKPNGLLMFEFWHAPAMLRFYEPMRFRTWHTADKEIIRISQTSLEPQTSLASVSYTIYELAHDGTYRKLSETQKNRYFLLTEMKQLLHTCGYSPIKWFSGFRYEEKISESDWHIVVIAKAES